MFSIQDKFKMTEQQQILQNVIYKSYTYDIY